MSMQTTVISSVFFFFFQSQLSSFKSNGIFTTVKGRYLFSFLMMIKKVDRSSRFFLVLRQVHPQEWNGQFR